MQSALEASIFKLRVILKRVVYRFTLSRIQRKHMATIEFKVSMRLHQIQQAWFNQWVTQQVKLKTFAMHHTHSLLRHWFSLKKTKPVRSIRKMSIDILWPLMAPVLLATSPKRYVDRNAAGGVSNRRKSTENPFLLSHTES